MRFDSKEELDEKQKFSLLPQDDYELIIVGLEPATRDKYMAKPNKDGSIPKEEIINVTLEVIACKDGEGAFDEEGNSAVGRKVFFTIRKDSMGFTTAGIPSKSRSFVANATNQDVNGSIELKNWEDLNGKTIYAEIVQYKNTKGQLRNKIERIVSSPKKSRKITKTKEKNPLMDDVEEIGPEGKGEVITEDPSFNEE